MENKPDTDYLNDPDRFLAITNTEQLVDEFGGMFDKTMLGDKVSIYLEKNQYGEDTPEERFLATDTSLVILKGEGVWDMSKEDQELLETVHKTLVTIKVAAGGYSSKFDKDILVNGKIINVKYKPYTLNTSEYILEELRKRKKLLQKDN